MAGDMFDAMVLSGVVSAGASQTCVLTRPLTFYDASVNCVTTAGGGQTISVTTAGGACINAIPCATANNITRAGDTATTGVNNANASAAVASTVTFTNGGGAGTAVGVCNAYCFVTGSGTAL